MCITSDVSGRTDKKCDILYNNTKEGWVFSTEQNLLMKFEEKATKMIKLSQPPETA